MSIKQKLSIMSFLQFFVWGAWLITIGNYWFATKQWTGTEFGAVFSTLGIASIIMPPVMGIIADKWMNAEKLYALLHFICAIFLFFIAQVDDPQLFFWVMLGAMMAYMPTISLSNSIAYDILKQNNLDVIRDFPPIRVLGTVGFILAMWVTNLTGCKASSDQFLISAGAGVLLALFSLTLPAVSPKNQNDQSSKSFSQIVGLDAFKLFANYKMALFFVFSMLLGAALQLTNMYGDTFLSDFGKLPEYAHSFIVERSTIVMSISQISETLFILAIPFFLQKYGIKKVMLISMIAWVFRFGLFAYGDPAEGLWMILLSNIIYGMAFDFFNISGSLFVETTTHARIRSSAQGLFMMMTNGFGAILGSLASGYVIDKYYVTNGIKDWHGIWLLFAGYALVVSVLFLILFQHKHTPSTHTSNLSRH